MNYQVEQHAFDIYKTLLIIVENRASLDGNEIVEDDDTSESADYYQKMADKAIYLAQQFHECVNKHEQKEVVNV